MKTLIISCHCNNTEFIKLQHYSLNKFFNSEYDYIIFNDAKTYADKTNFFDNNLKQKINETCLNLNIKCVEIPQEIHSDRTLIFKNTLYPKTFDIGTRCSDTLQYAYNYAISLEGYDYLFILDSDMFFINHFNINEYINNYQICGIFQSGGSIIYLWSAISIFNLKKCINLNQLNWECGKIDNNSVDVGGNTYYYIRDYNPLIKPITNSHYSYADSVLKINDEKLKLLLLEICNISPTKSCNKEIMLNNAIIHVRGGSNWDYKSEDFFYKQFELIKNYILML